MTVEVVYSPSLVAETGTLETLDPKMRQVAAQLSNWVDNAKAVTNRSSMFDRGAYVAPDSVYRQMHIARHAVDNDDVVGGLAEVTEGLALDGVKWEGTTADDTDVFNQMAAEQDLDAIVRRMWREEFTYSQVIHGFWWTTGNFTVRGVTSKGVKRKRNYTVRYPRAITTLDSEKVVPVGMLHFGQERLAWQGTSAEIGQYVNVLDGVLTDELMTRFYAGQYIPTDPDEMQELVALGCDISRLILFDESVVKRHTLTKADHARFADLRLKRVFKLLDLKQQLMEADRVSLIGAANYILLVRKGTKDDPAYPEEITNLKENFNFVAKLPVIVSDHRLEIDIITPAQDYTLDYKKYDALDNRIIASILGLFGSMGQSGNRSDNSLGQARLVARGMENRRHMIKRYLERHIAKAVFDDPANAGVFEGDAPSLTFMPRNIQLDSDAGVAQAIIALRQSNELSRESTLEYFGFDQAVEAMRRTLEDEMGLDDIFKTMVPFNSPANTGEPGKAGGQPNPTGNPTKKAVTPKATPMASGTRGGRPVGGGAPKRNATKAVNVTGKGTTRPQTAAEEADDDTEGDD